MVLTRNRRDRRTQARAELARPSRGHPFARKLFLATAGVLALALAAGSGAAIWGIRYAEGKVPVLPTGPSCTENGCLKHVTTKCAGQVCYFLVLGSDSRVGFNASQQSQFGGTQQVQGQRSDTIILVRTDLAHNKTTVVSIPRDLLVDIPGHGQDKINSAFDYGADVTVQTVEKLFGVTINHYVEVNFLGFMRVVNALGGVPVCIDRPMIDTLAGLRLPHAGCYNLTGAQALAFVRARHVQGDAIPDFSRISRQQQFIRAALQKILAPAALTHLPALINALSDNFIRDKALTLYAIRDLTDRLGAVGQRGVDFRVLPSIPVTVGAVDYVELQQPGAAKFIRLFREGKYLGRLGQGLVLTQISPANITIQLYDANSGGKAQQVASYLERAGFVVLPVAPAPSGMTKTELLYGPTERKPEGVVSSYLPRVPPAFTASGTPGATVVVVIGPDFKGIE